MHIEEYITSVGKQHRNERQNYEFHSISSLRKFVEDWEQVNQNLVKPDVSGPSEQLKMFENMQYYMEHCIREGYCTPQQWIEKYKHF